MENSKKRKWGPYKQYLFKDSGASVPRSTKYELEHPEQKRPRLSAFRKKVLSKSQASNTVERPCLTSNCNDVNSAANTVNTAIPPEVDEVSLELPPNDNISDNYNDNVNILTADDFVPIGVDVTVCEDDNDEHEIFQNDEEELFEQLTLEDLIEDSAGNEPDDEDDPYPSDESSDEECATAPNLHLSNGDRIKLLLLLATKKRHNLTYSAAESFVKFSGLVNKNQDMFSATKHLMKEAITAYSSDLTLHYLCSNCGSYIGRLQNTIACNNCHEAVDPNQCKKVKSYFLYYSVKEQIKALLESGLEPHLIDPHDRSKMCQFNYEDVFDGKMYKRLVPRGALSFHFFVDGLQVSSTSKFSAWPVLLTLNELPLHLRRKFVMMASVWLNKKKPEINQYMKPFVEECVDMHHNGIDYKVNGHCKNKQIVALMGVSDSVARPLLRNSKQFNGKYGCGLCYHPGYRLRFGRGTIRSYSLRNGDFPMRSHEETMQLAREGDRTGIFQRGIRGSSILSNIPNFDIVHGLDLDIFHCLVNVAKRFTNLWIGKKRLNEPYNVRNRLSIIDRRLLAITTTNDISRAPRSLTERSDFRGHEWFNWVLFYSVPVLKNILPAIYLNHWSILVHAISLMMQNSVAKSELLYAGRYLKQFNQEIDRLYGSVHVTFSVHLLTHLETSVMNFAQPWTHSAFTYESFLGELKASVKSSNGVGEQVTKHMQLKIALQKMRYDLDSSMSEQEREYLSNMMTSTKNLAEPNLILGHVALLGDPEKVVLSEENRHALVRSDIAFDRNEEYSVYQRVIFDSELFQSCFYKRVKRQDNNMVLLESGKVFQIQCFLVVSNVCYAMGHYFKERRNAMVCDRQLPHYILVGDKELLLRCLPISQFKMKLLFFSVKLSEQESLRLGCVNVLKTEMLN